MLDEVGVILRFKACERLAEKQKLVVEFGECFVLRKPRRELVSSFSRLDELYGYLLCLDDIRCKKLNKNKTRKEDHSHE